MKKIVLGLLLLAIIVGVYVWFFVYNKSHKDYQSAEASYVGTAIDFRQMAVDDNASFMETYLNEAVKVSGTITDVSTSLITINENLFCKLADSELEKIFQAGQNIQLKGRLVGSDEDILTGEIVCQLDQCIVE